MKILKTFDVKKNTEIKTRTNLEQSSLIFFYYLSKTYLSFLHGSNE